MNDIEKKALALLNEVLADRVDWQMTGSRADNASIEALCRAIEQHEAFRQEVSDALSVYQKAASTQQRSLIWDALTRFIIAKPDPLVEIMAEVNDMNDAKAAEQLREALAKRGGKIVWEEG